MLLPLAGRADEAAVKAALARPILTPRQALLELQDHVEGRLPKIPAAKTAAEWEAVAARLRQEILDRAVLRGEAAAWAKAKGKVEYLDTIAGGEGYKIRKLRYEAVPGMWVPALLYVPDAMLAKTPVMLAVNGHEPKGKAAGYKQIRCINLAKRGMLVLSPEWFGTLGVVERRTTSTPTPPWRSCAAPSRLCGPRCTSARRAPGSAGPPASAFS